MNNKTKARVPVEIPLDSLIFILKGHEVYMDYALPGISLTLMLSLKDAILPSYSVSKETIKEILRALSIHPGNENLIKKLQDEL